MDTPLKAESRSGVFDAELLDELALCFAEAAVRALLKSQEAGDTGAPRPPAEAA